MAAKVCDDLLLGNITYKSLTDWLGSKVDSDDIPARYSGVRRDEFVNYFQKALRTSASRILNLNTDCAPTKKVKSYGIRSAPATVQVDIRNYPGGNETLDPTVWSLRNSPDSVKKCVNAKVENFTKGRHDFAGSSNLAHFTQTDLRQRRGKTHRFKNTSESVTQSKVSNSDNVASFFNPATSYGNHTKDVNSSPEYSRSAARIQPQTTTDTAGLKGRHSFGGIASLGDFIQIENKGKSNRSKNITPRRINPTRLTPSKVSASGTGNIAFTENWNSEMGEGFSCATTSKADSVTLFTEAWDTNSVPGTPAGAGTGKDLTAVRDLLRIERLKTQLPSARVPAIAGLPIADTEMANASLEKVEDRARLDILISVYCYLLDANLALNLSTEIIFLTNLLVVNDVPHAETAPSSLLDSVHNCVYFACNILNQERHLLTMYDRNSLKLLVESDRIAHFKPELALQLEQLFEEVKMIQEHPNRDGTSANVNFHCETDNKQNFPTEFLFHSFKKQRDLFYEALQTWERGHISPNWSFTQSLGAKIKLMVGGGNEEPANLVHFCRLFCCQLLGNCSGTLESGEDDLDDDTRCFLKSLKSQDPNKYARLKERLVRPQLANTAQRSDFPGHQEFYRDFILTANNAKLNAHMIDSFSNEIAAICSASVASLRVEDLNGADKCIVDDTTSHTYAASVASLRVLAKFLGFLTFLPYRSDISLTNNIASRHAATRANTNPPVDVSCALREAVAGHQLVLTVPWVTKYLSMADSVTMTLPYYVGLTNMLFQLYITVGQDDSETCPSTVLLVRLSLGWLFETPSFPGGQFLSWYFDRDRPAASVGLSPSADSTGKRGGLDCVPLAGHASVLHAACPSLRRLAVVLATQGGSASRHVTPAAVARRKNPQEATQLKLEESFFQGQVASLKRTVTFVAERVANGCITHVTVNLLPQLKATTLTEHKHELADLSVERQQEIAKSHATMCACRCWEEVSLLCFARTSAALEALLPHDMPPAVRQVSAKIAARMAHDKARVWMEDNMIARSFEKDLASDLERLHRKAVKKMRGKPRLNTKSLAGSKTSHTIEPGARNVQHNEDACTPAKSMIELRELVISLRTYEPVAVRSVMKALGNLKEVCLHREDLIPAGEGILHSLFMELLFYVSFKRSSWLPEVLPLACSLWVLPELCPTAQDAVDLVSPLKIRELAESIHQPALGLEFLLLLKVVMRMDHNAPRCVRNQLLKLKNKPELYKGLVPTIDDILNRMSGSARK